MSAAANPWEVMRRGQPPPSDDEWSVVAKDQESIKRKYGLPASTDLTKGFFDTANNEVKDTFSFSEAVAEFKAEPPKKLGLVRGAIQEFKDIGGALVSHPAEPFMVSEIPMLGPIPTEPSGAIPIVGPMAKARIEQFETDPWGAVGAGVVDIATLGLLGRGLVGGKPKAIPAKQAAAQRILEQRAQAPRIEAGLQAVERAVAPTPSELLPPAAPRTSNAINAEIIELQAQLKRTRSPERRAAIEARIAADQAERTERAAGRLPELQKREAGEKAAFEERFARERAAREAAKAAEPTLGQRLVAGEKAVSAIEPEARTRALQELGRIQAAQRAKLEAPLTAEELDSARGLIMETADFLKAQERPGVYFAEAGEGEQVLAGRKRGQGERRGGVWYGITSRRGDFPWLKEVRESPKDMEAALARGKGPVYERLLEAAGNWIKQERTAIEPVAPPRPAEAAKPPEPIPAKIKAPEPTAKQPWEMTGKDLVSVAERRFPKGAYKGELRDSSGNLVGNVYLQEGRVYVGDPKEYGRGEVVKMLPGSFDPKEFTKAGGVQISSSQRVQYWKFKTPAAKAPEPPVPKQGLGPAAGSFGFLDPAVWKRIIRWPFEKIKPPTAPPAVVSKIGALADDVISTMDDQISLLSREAQTILQESEAIAATGTLAKELRPGIRAKGAPQPTRLVSEARTGQVNAAVTHFARQLKSIRRDAELTADPLTRQQLRSAEVQFEALAQEYRKYRRAAGRTVKAFDYPVEAELLDELARVGLGMKRIRQVGHREPLIATVREALQNGQIKPLLTAPIDYVRVNLFPLFSAARDLLTNAGALGSRIIEAGAQDLYDGGKRTAGMLRAIRGRPWREMPIRIQQELGSTALGERFAPLTGRNIDKLLFAPAYAKAGVDSFFKRYGAMSSLYERTLNQAKLRGLKGREKAAFVDQHVFDVGDAEIAATAEQGNRLGFNRNLSAIEEQIGRSRTVQVFINAYPRWSMQFTRWLAEHTPLSPDFWGKVKSGNVTGADIVGFATRNATGLGGVYLVSETIYPNVDFNSMEYRREDGSRIRLTGLTPIPDALALVALIKGDLPKFWSAMQHSSLPLVHLNGLLAPILQASEQLVRGAVSMEHLGNEFISFVNRLIPGQGVLAAIEAMLDPTVRRGVGANVPVLSLTKEPVIEPTTGKPRETRQILPGGKTIPYSGGLGFPGLARQVNPVEMLFLDHGLGVYRPRRTPIGALPEEEVSPALRQEFERLRGQRINEQATRLMENKSFLALSWENRKEVLEKLRTDATKYAKSQIIRKEELFGKAPKRKSIRELRMPAMVLREEENVSRIRPQ
jgi:hypothetical protein